MSIASDFISIADRVWAFLHRREQSDAAVFNELIHPLFSGIDDVADATLAMYSPLLKELGHSLITIGFGMVRESTQLCQGRRGLQSATFCFPARESHG